ncbi:MAG TPA: hypothetical protein VLG49_04775 [Rhabdochlamydiaceae bacterium]|nr:hypothetical protein [Rhabdochlamydiaceae bacterium]
MHSTSLLALRALLWFDFTLRLESIGCNARSLPNLSVGVPSSSHRRASLVMKETIRIGLLNMNHFKNWIAQD